MSATSLMGQSGISMPSGQFIGASNKGEAGSEGQEFHKKKIEDIIRLFDSNLDFGLTDDKVNLAKRKYHITKDDEDETSFIEQIKEQFEDRTVRLLLAAALVSFLTNFFSQDGQDELPAWVEPCVIIAILVCNGMVAIYQDRKADEATKELEGLKQMRVLVKRNGLWVNIPSHELVPGDIVQLRQGAKVYADCRLVQMQSIVITVNEINLTGQKKEVQKCITENEKVESELQSLNMLFAGSIVRMGRAVAIVCRTGNSCTINSQKKGTEDDEDSTLLEQKLDAFGKFLEIAVFYICIFIWVMNFTNFREPLLGGFIKGCLYYFKIAVSLAVAALPEGLPTVITACLALGTRREPL